MIADLYSDGIGVNLRASNPSLDAARDTMLTAVLRDVSEHGFAVIPDFLDTGEVDALRQVSALLVAKYRQLQQISLRTLALAVQYITRCHAVVGM